MKRYLVYMRIFFMMKFAILVLILGLCVFPLNAYAGGGSGPHGPSDGSDNSSLETGVWVVVMILIGVGLYSVLKKEKAEKQTSHIDSSKIDIPMEGFVKSNDPDITPTGELVVFRW